MSFNIDELAEGDMDLERIAGALAQAVLGAIWITVIALTVRVYLIIARPRSATDPLLNSSEERIKQSFAAFTFGFMPALAAWLPVFGWLPSADQMFVPAALTWLVLLVFGTLQFHLNLIPARAAVVAVVSIEAGGSFGAAAPSDSDTRAQPRRNV